METAIAAVATALGGTAAAAFTFLLTKRRFSGRVATTDADTLWKNLIAQLAQRDSRITGLEAEMGKLAGELYDRDREIHRLETRIGDLEAEVARKDSRIAHLEHELEARLRAAQAALEQGA